MFYLETAWDLLDGRLSEIPYRTIGYPLLLLLSGFVPEPGRTLYFIQFALHVALIFLGGAILYRAGARRWMLIAFPLIMLVPPYAQITALVLAESPAEFCLMAGVAAFYFFLRRPERTVLALASGVFLAAAALTRPGFQLLSLVLAALPLAPVAVAGLRQHRPPSARPIIGAILLGSVPVAATLGYSFFNWRRFGYFGPTPLLGHNLVIRTAQFYKDISDPEIRRILLEARNARCMAGEEPELAIADVNARLRSMANDSRVEHAARLQRTALALIRRHRVEYAREVARSFAAFWLPQSDYEEGLEWHVPASGPASFAVPERRHRLLPLPRRVIPLLQLLELAITLLFVGSAILYAGLAAAGGLGLARVRPNPDTALLYAACVFTVLYNAFVCSAVDRGAPHQRECTEVFLVLAVLLALVMLRELRRSARAPVSI